MELILPHEGLNRVRASQGRIHQLLFSMSQLLPRPWNDTMKSSAIMTRVTNTIQRALIYGVVQNIIVLVQDSTH